MKCENNRTIVLICHASKVLLKIMAQRMKVKLKEEIVEEQSGFISQKGTRNQFMNLKLIIEKYRDYNKTLYICFIDYRKAFDKVSYNKPWQIMRNIGFPQHLLKLLQVLYQGQRAAVRTGYGLKEWFSIEQGVRQGCILSPFLFNIYSESIMREALKGFEGSIKLRGRTVTTLRYADDVALLAGSANELQELLNRTQVASRERGLKLNVEKTKVMLISKNSNQEDFKITLEGETIEIVKEFKYLGTLITDNYDDTKEIRRRIAIAKYATVSLNKIWKDKSISKRTKIRLPRSLVFAIATYASECWAMKKNDRARIHSFEIWAYRRLLRVSGQKRDQTKAYVRRSFEYKGLVNQIE